MAEWREVPIITGAFESVDDVQVDQFNATIVDAVPVQVGENTHLVKRPGLQEFVDLGTNASVDGLYWFDRGHVAIAVSGGHVFKISDTLGTTVEILGSIDVASNIPVRFASDATRVIMATGGKLVYTDLSTLTTVADADAPTDASHVAVLDGYILANDGGSGVIKYSDLNDMTSWQGLSFFTAESKPDDVVAMAEGFREIIALGRESVEFWVNDGQNPFSRIQGSAQPFGTEAPYSLALAGSTWMWLDQNRRFATMQGRQVVTVSSPYDRVIQRYQAVNNAVGYSISIEGMPLYILSFPTDGETLVYNYMTQQWHKWGYWVEAGGVYHRYRGQSYCFARDWNKHLVGDIGNGKVYVSSRQIFSDADNPIRSLVRTGHISHGIHTDKSSDIFRLHCKRSTGGSQVADPQIVMRRRVNNRPIFQSERWRSLGKVGQHFPYVEWKANGIYRTCQYEFVHSDRSDLVLMGAQEYLTVLDR